MAVLKGSQALVRLLHNAGYLQGLLLADRRLRGWFGVGMGDGGYANLHVHRRTVSCSIIVERLLLTHG